MLGSLSTGTPPTDEERVTILNRKVAPEGYFTNTHFIMSWPAIKGKHVDVQPLPLKTSLEYSIISHTEENQRQTRAAFVRLNSVINKTWL